MSKSNAKRRTVLVRTRRQPFAALRYILVALAGGGCGERLEIGELGQGLDPSDTESTGIDAPVIVDGPEDADAIVYRSAGYAVATTQIGMVRGVGDVDGDGYGDWLSDGQLTYGRPRPADGVLIAPLDEGPSFVSRYIMDDPYASRRAGDVNGDGYDDLIFDSLAPDLDKGTDRDDVDLAEASLRWATQRAFLWLGRSDRSPGERELAMAAVPLGGHDDLAGMFQSELTAGPSADASVSFAQQVITPEALGDIDGDGYADLGVSATFSWELVAHEQREDWIEQVTRNFRRESVSYIYYGGNQALAIGVAPEPDARLQGVIALQSIGDVNGDGYADLEASTAQGIYSLPGGEQRFSGDLPSLDGRGVPMSSPASQVFHITNVLGSTFAVGDLDRDGFDDLVVHWDYEDARYALFYGSPEFLQQPVDSRSVSALFTMPSQNGSIQNIGDWNGDGSTDMLFVHQRSITESDIDPARGAARDVRLIPGSPARYSGVHEFAASRPDASQTEHYATTAHAAGDLDGDGMADLFFRATAATATPPKSLAWHVRYGGPLPSNPIH